MSGRIANHLDFLVKVAKHRGIIKTAVKSQISILVEIIYNLLRNNLFLTKKERTCLLREYQSLLDISRTRDVDVARRLLLKLKQSTITSFVQATLALNGLNKSL